MDPHAARRIEILNYVLGAVATGASLLVCTQPQVIGLFVGALLGALNFTAIRRLVEKQIAAQKEGGSARQTILIFPKMLVLIAAVGAAILYLPIEPAFLAIGFSIFIASIAIETIRFLTNPGDSSGDESDTGGEN